MIAPMARNGEEPMARWATTPRWPSSRTASRRCSPTSSSCSRRSRTRRSTRSAESVVMSLSTGVGAEGNLLTEIARAGPPAGDAPADPAQRRAREAAPGLPRRLSRRDAGHHLADRGRGRRNGGAAHAALREAASWSTRRQHPDPVGPQRRARARRDPVAARRRCSAPAPGPPRHAAAHRARDRVGRAARDPSHGDADRLRRGGDQPVPDVRVARRARRPPAAAGGLATRGGRDSGSSRRSARDC